jgi:hypothetical protein
MRDTDKDLARKRFESHFGKLQVSEAIDIDNEGNDAGLAKAYAERNLQHGQSKK